MPVSKTSIALRDLLEAFIYLQYLTDYRNDWIYDTSLDIASAAQALQDEGYEYCHAFKNWTHPDEPDIEEEK